MRTSLSRGWHSSWFQTFCQVLWVGAVILLPITSLPLIRNLSGASTVAPPSAGLLLLLSLVWLLPFFLQKGRTPVEGVPLLLFGCAIVLSWGVSLFIETPSFRGRNILTEAPQAFITLAVGLAAYFVPATWLASRLSEPVSEGQDRLRFTLRLINISGAVLLLWSLAQAIFVFFNNSHYPDLMMDIQSLISSRRIPLFAARVTGLAYEPSWLAHQLNLLYLPLWLSATLLGFSAHRRKLWRFSVENLLLLAGAGVLFISFSRVGVIAFLLVVGCVAIYATLKLVKRVSIWITSRLQTIAWRPGMVALVKVALSAVLVVSFLAIYAGAAYGLFRLGARFEPRLGRILEEDFLEASSFLEVTNKLAFAERVIYWVTGLDVFRDHPFSGVGLGNAGFYFSEKMPSFGWGLWEISLIFNYRTLMPNTKSLWVRILAEGGLGCFAVFLGWYYLLWRSAWFTKTSAQPGLRVVGLAGVFVLIGFLIEGFSVDSFALPYFWFSIGLVCAAASLARRSTEAG